MVFFFCSVFINRFALVLTFWIMRFLDLPLMELHFNLNIVPVSLPSRAGSYVYSRQCRPRISSEFRLCIFPHLMLYSVQVVFTVVFVFTWPVHLLPSNLSKSSEFSFCFFARQAWSYPFFTPQGAGKTAVSGVWGSMPFYVYQGENVR